MNSQLVFGHAIEILVKSMKCTKYNIYCHMAFDVVPFWMTLLINKPTNDVMDDGYIGSSITQNPTFNFTDTLLLLLHPP